VFVYAYYSSFINVVSRK